MAKHTYGFPAGTDPDQAIEEAIAKAREDGFLKDGTSYSTEVPQTDTFDDRPPANRPEAARPAPEMRVVIRTSES